MIRIIIVIVIIISAQEQLRWYVPITADAPVEASRYTHARGRFWKVCVLVFLPDPGALNSCAYTFPEQHIWQLVLLTDAVEKLRSRTGERASTAGRSRWLKAASRCTSSKLQLMVLTPDLPTNIIPTNIAWLQLSGESPTGLRIPTL